MNEEEKVFTDEQDNEMIAQENIGDPSLPEEEIAVGDAGTEAVPAQVNSEEDQLILKHFPNVEVTDAIRGDLLVAARKIERHDKINRELAEIAEADPTFGRILIDLRKGADFQTALSRHVDVENLSPMKGDPNYDEWQSNISKRKETMAEKERRIAEEQQNIESSVQALKEFKESKGLADEDAEGFIKYMMEVLDAAFSGKLTPEFINRMYLAMNYDADTDNNYHKGLQEGTVKARNEKLSDLKEKEEGIGTGLPDMSGGGGKMAAKKPQSYGAKFLEDVLD